MQEKTVAVSAATGARRQHRTTALSRIIQCSYFDHPERLFGCVVSRHVVLSLIVPPAAKNRLSAVMGDQPFSPLYVTKSVIDSRAVWGIICLLFLVKNRKEAEDGPGGFFR
ncbi:MAG: hypothetical protein ABSF90_29110, partial [Syntrophobacteraceae bacterium]